MLERSRFLALTLFVSALVVVAAGCDGDSSGEAETPTEQPSATGTAVDTAEPDIRDVVLADEPGLSEFVSQTGGVVDSSRVLYEDLTGSGADEAIVPVSSGGEGGDIAVFVYGYVDGNLEKLMRAIPTDTSITADIEDGQLVTTQGSFAPGDPLCCPSQLTKSYYAWDGSSLTVEREEQEPAP